MKTRAHRETKRPHKPGDSLPKTEALPGRSLDLAGASTVRIGLAREMHRRGARLLSWCPASLDGRWRGGPVVAMPRFHVTPIDKRILKPGWAGEPEPSELVFLKERLEKDQRLAVRWGFDLATTKRPEWAILQVAMWGNPKQQALNTALTRREINVLHGVQVPLL